MPSIKKLKAKGDIKGLINELMNKKPNVRKEAVEALYELKNVEGLIEALNKGTDVRIRASEFLKAFNDTKAIENLNKNLISILKYGEMEDQLEAITVIQGRYPSWFMISWLENWSDIEDAFKSVKKKMDLKTFRDHLIGIVEQKKYFPCMWYSLVALIELGDRTDEVFTALIDLSQSFFQKLHDERSLITYGASKSIHEETLRALSYFKDNKLAIDFVIKAFNDKFLSGVGASKENAIYALGALGDPSELERLKYTTNEDNETISNAAKIAIEFYGNATFDEIKLKAESIQKT